MTRLIKRTERTDGPAAAARRPAVVRDERSVPAPQEDRAGGSAPRVRFWGVRGSHPAIRPSGSRIGGHTTCVELRYGRHVLVFDAGSGCIPLGDALMAEWQRVPLAARSTLTVLFTHAHHDHLCGLPFFAPLFVPDADLHLLGPDLAGLRFEQILARYMGSPYFPVEFDELPSRRHMRSIGDGARLVWERDATGPALCAPGRSASPDALVVDVLHSTLHPRNGTLVYRVTAGGHSLIFATDVEIGERGGEGEQRFIRFARGADVLVHDAQYTEDDYAGATPHRGYGHSTPAMAARIAHAAEVGRLVLFHHDPTYADAGVLAQLDAARALFPRVLAAREGLEICLDESEPPHI